MKMKAVICDLDGTLTDANHRRHFVEGNSRDWNKFFASAKNDTVNQWCLETIKGLQKIGYEILFITARPSFCLKDTVDWLHLHTPFKVSMGYNLFMRKDGDRRPDYEIKEEIYKNLVKPNYDILLAIDDKKEVIKMWESNKIPVLFCGSFLTKKS